MMFLTISIALSEKIAKVEAYGILPETESPAAVPPRDVPQTDQTSILKVLRENGKTLNIKNIIENLK